MQTWCQHFAVNNAVDMVSNIFFFFCQYLFNPLALLVLASSFPNLEKLSMNQQLNFPKNGGCLIAALCLCFLGSFLIAVGIFLGMLGRVDSSSSSLISQFLAFVVLPFCSIALTQVYWFISVFILSTWISKFAELCAEVPDCDIVIWSKECLSL